MKQHIYTNNLKLSKMKKPLKKSTVATHAILTTATVLAIQSFSNVAYGQVLKTEKSVNAQLKNSRAADNFLKIKMESQRTSIVGMLNGSPVYKNDRGEYFSVNAQNGDLNYLSNEKFAEFSCCIKIGDIKGERTNAKSSQNKSLTYIKFESDAVGDVQIIGLDKEGHTIHKNSRGEAFYVDSITGDLIYVKL
ncbi:MAG: hypothetical protein CO119_01080 [Flavobacteriales bacterium CG_4_9_14_3_um_filter_40_17]|nr:MAG: hypothetical protein CO119_01080 [Flavobacteriales bacterium CG_4_9_14_3_um_filter_40_17]